jgi:4-hydroxybenzoate polyprenyltransferase
MGSLAAQRMIDWRVALRLGRVSNLPTVWSNVIAGTVLAGGPASLPQLLLVAGAMSLFYVGGMYLNDAFDREIDARERPSRPIPAGEATAAGVTAIGFGMLAIGVALLASFGNAAALAGLALAGAIVLYDLYHKDNPASPFLMGLCRALVYIGAAAAVSAGAALQAPVLIGASLLLLFVAGLTLAAKQERLERVSQMGPLLLLVAPLAAALPLAVSSWQVPLAFAALLGAVAYALSLLRRRGPGDVGRAVGLLIAAIALVDALAAATAGATLAMGACFVLFALTLLLQRHVPGT